MKQKISICILIVIFIFFGTFLIMEYKNKEFPNTEKQLEMSETEIITEDSTEIGKIEEYYEYIILEDDGRLSVYYSDNVTIYLHTGIAVTSLPEDIKEKLKTGIRIKTEADLFDFLESYSS